MTGKIHPSDAWLHDPTVLGVNKLPGRSPLIPSDRPGVFYGNKEDSHFLLSLNGDWRFLYCPSGTTSLPASSLSCDDTAWDTIDVPSMWQFRGYGKCAYTNISYPFPFDPPYIDCDDPCGWYRRHFTLDAVPPRAILHFAGVDNAFYVWINGCFTGFSKGSRNAAEFDVAPYLVPGDNLISVRVIQYSDASYLECQDMLFASGIFRDVYLLSLPDVNTWDYRVSSDLSSFTVRVSLSRPDPACAVTVDIDGISQTLPGDSGLVFTISPREVRLWNAETPYLYRLTLTLSRGEKVLEVHSKAIGMMHTTFTHDPARFLVNGAPVYIKGVNRHEYNTDNGRGVSREQMRREVLLIKRNNLNAIRTSHYPDDPYFYELCSSVGLYVMDEADCETHGAQETGDQGYLSKLPLWREAYLDRARRMLENSKNEPCVFIHSTGNECGAGENLVAMQRLMEEFDPDHVAIHDQETDHDKMAGHKALEEGDNLLRMGYLSEAALEEVDRNLPIYMQIEYGHAMGNSPGFLMGYQAYTYSHPKCIGGFLWEFKNHGFHVGGTNDYLYGGDFGDKGHWSNFCLDGYLLSDGTPKYTWNEVFEAMTPVWVDGEPAKMDGGYRVTLLNTTDFTCLSSFRCEASLERDGIVIAAYAAPLPACRPHERVSHDIPLAIPSPDSFPGSEYALTLRFFKGDAIAGTHQALLGTPVPGHPYAPAKGTLSVDTAPRTVTVTGKDFSVSFTNGLPSRYEKGGQLLADRPLRFNFMRAPIDNDGISGMYRWAEREAIQWKEALIDTMAFVPHEVRAESLPSSVRVTATGRILPQSRYYGFEATVTCDVDADGLVLVRIDAAPYGRWPDPIPRIGLTWDLPGSYDTIRWYGRGPRESYPDAIAAAPIGHYATDVAHSYTVFDRPQDSGDHENTRVLTLTSSSLPPLSVIGCREFAFETHDMSLDTLLRARHRSDVKPDGKTHLYIDYRMRGLGSHSCGPMPEPPFELHAHAFTFGFAIVPGLDEENALKIWRQDFGIRVQAGPIRAASAAPDDQPVPLL